MPPHRLRIDIPELIAAFEMNSYEVQNYLDRETGKIILVVDETLGGEEPPDLDDDRHILVPTVDSHEAYRDMEDFTETVTDPTLQRLLLVALDGAGAFRRFKNVLSDFPDERERWFAYKDQQMRRRVVAWLASEGLEVIEE